MITVIAGLAALTALSSALLVQRSRRRQVEQTFRAAEAALRSSCTEAQHLADRLVATHESERARLARDLHDNLGQKLALLSMEIQSLNVRAALSPATIAASVSQLLECATDIANDVRDLSHDLYPPKLHILGLAPAIESLCREMSRQGHLRIEFRQRGVSRRIPPETALCLFRIAQEALQNVVKHSGGTVAIVRLCGTARNIRLDVADAGKGFDQASSSGQGLGLLSMRERAHLAGGRAGIRSAIDKGTRIVVTLPVNGEPARRPSSNTQEIGTSHLVREAPSALAATPAKELRLRPASQRSLTAFGSRLFTGPVVGPTRHPIRG